MNRLITTYLSFITNKAAKIANMVEAKTAKTSTLANL